MKKLNEKTISELRKIINDDNDDYNYRSGPELVNFFNKIGFQDEYFNFPSRKDYTEGKLHSINGTEHMNECIKLAFEVINFIDKYDKLDELINQFNKYLNFDGYEIIRSNDIILIKEKNENIIKTSNNKERKFLNEYSIEKDISVLKLNKEMENLIRIRLNEIKISLNNNSPLSAIFMMGSVLEGILFDFSKSFEDLYLTRAKELNPKIKNISQISLNDLIIISYENKFLKKDVNEFSHNLRKFRNYIHPNAQLKEDFYPDLHTAEICWAVLQATIYQLSLVNRDIH